MLAVQNILDDIELSFDGRRFYGCTVTLKCCDNLARLFIFALADQKTR